MTITISVPSTPTNNAAGIVNYNAQFVANVASALGTVLSNLEALPDNTDFLTDGDLPNLDYSSITPPHAPAVPTLMDVHPDRAQLNWSYLAAKIDQLAALAAPDAPDTDTVTADVPDFTATPPTLSVPTAPDLDVGAAPNAVPSLDEPALPDAPVVALPSVPSFEDLALPAPPSFVIPTFTAEAPQFLITAPTAEFDYVDSGYVSSLRDPLVSKLLNDLTTGTYGIESAVEDALWGRARDRAAQVAREEIDAIVRGSAATSFPMPTGAMRAAIAKAQHKYQAALSEANRAISEKRADMYVEGRKFTIQQVQEYERTAIALYNAVQERALNTAKAVFEYAIARFNASVAHFNAQQEAFKSQAQVFETLVRAELVKAEIFRTQIDAERLRIDFNRAKIEQYRAQLDGIQTVVDLYKARLGAATVFMQLQQQKLDVFRTQVQVFSEQVRAKESEAGLYRAQLAGELSKVQLYNAQIEGHNARIAGIQATAGVTLASNQALVQRYDTETRNYLAQVASFNTQIDALLGEARGKTEQYRGYVDAAKAYASSLATYNTDYAAIQELNLRGHTTVIESRRKEAEFNLERTRLTAELSRAVNTAVAQGISTLLASVASGMSSVGMVTTEEA